MSQFGMAQESADLGYENEAPMANGEETHTVANEIAEVQNLQFEAADEDAAADKLENEAEQTEEVAEVLEEDVAQERALDPTAAKLLKLTFQNIVGKHYAGRTLPATESFNGSRSEAREQTRIALEGVKETLRKFWEAIKAQFKKVYNKVKDWIVKTFSAAKKLSERAKKIQDKANSTVGTIEDKSFSFGQTKAIAVEGKYNEPGKLTTGLNDLRKVIVGTVTELKKDSVDTKIEELVTAIKNGFSGSGSSRVTADVAGLRTAVQKTISGATLGTITATVGDVTKYKAQFGDVADSNIEGVFGLPGSKAIIAVTYTGAQDTIESAVKALKGNKLLLAADKYNPRDVSEGDVKTLTTSQIDKVCDDVIEIAESVYTFEKNWKENDKFVEKVQKEVDDSIKDFDQEEDADSTDQRHFRNFCNSAVGAIRRHTNFKANLCSYGVTTSNAFLNYAERSLSQHKAK